MYVICCKVCLKHHTIKRQTYIIKNKCCAVVCDFILKCLESMRRYIPFNEMLFNVAV